MSSIIWFSCFRRLMFAFKKLKGSPDQIRSALVRPRRQIGKTKSTLAFGAPTAAGGSLGSITQRRLRTLKEFCFLDLIGIIRRSLACKACNSSF